MRLYIQKTVPPLVINDARLPWIAIVDVSTINARQVVAARSKHGGGGYSIYIHYSPASKRRRRAYLMPLRIYMFVV